MKIKPEPISSIRITHSMLAVAVVFALTVVMVLIGPGFLGEGVIALLYLVPIGWCTIRWGQIAGISAALTSALCFDFWFIPPYGTFNIGSLEGWLLLFLFTAAAILVVGRIQSILSEVQNRERKATFLYEMVSAIANQQTREGIARTVANQIQQIFMADIVFVHLISREQLPLINVYAYNGLEHTPKNKPDRTLPIISERTLIGEVDIWKGLISLPPEDDSMLQTMLRQTAAALDRAQVTEKNGPSTTQSLPEKLTI